MTARCDEHGVTLPCSGCRADQLEANGARAAALVTQGVPPERVRAILAQTTHTTTGRTDPA